MIQAQSWMRDLVTKLTSHFRNRLVFVGLQGSYLRNEAHEQSDIDAVVILDTLTMDDLSAYRTILSTMPEHEKACGFIAGKMDLLNWAKHELFQFEQDTCAYFGDMHALLPCFTRKDIIDSAKISASGLYHACCHTAVHDPGNLCALQGMFKGAFFLLQIEYYLQSGDYIRTKRELLPLLSGDAHEILRISMGWDNELNAVKLDSVPYFTLLLRWVQQILAASFPTQPLNSISRATTEKS